MSREDFADSLRTERHERGIECGEQHYDSTCTKGLDHHDGQHYDDTTGEGWEA